MLILILSFIQQNELTATEAKAILHTEHEVRNKRNKFNNNTGKMAVVHPSVPNVHLVRIAQLYVKMYVLGNGKPRCLRTS